MNNFENKHKIENNESQKIRELNVGIFKLSNDGNESYLLEFIKKYGIQESPLRVDEIRERNLYAFVSSSISQIERFLNYDQVIYFWNVLKNAGALSPDKLSKHIKRYVNSSMFLDKDEANNINKTFGSNLPSYSPEFIQEFLEDLKDRVKDGLGWDLDI